MVDVDVGTVEVLARLQLTARRHGSTLWLCDAGPGLRQLVVLVGLRDVLPCLPESGLQAEGKAEEREHASRIEEERDGADAVP
jgi:hypothetical protein